MGQHRKSDQKVRKDKYQRQFARTEANKKRHIEKMKKLNPNFPNKNEKKNG